jgi:hypothetical protein
LVNPKRGIFKPRRMRFLLSIRTVFPAAGRRVWYDDQREVHAQINGGYETVTTPSWATTRTPPTTGGYARLGSGRSRCIAGRECLRIVLVHYIVQAEQNGFGPVARCAIGHRYRLC